MGAGGRRQKNESLPFTYPDRLGSRTFCRRTRSRSRAGQATGREDWSRRGRRHLEPQTISQPPGFSGRPDPPSAPIPPTPAGISFRSSWTGLGRRRGCFRRQRAPRVIPRRGFRPPGLAELPLPSDTECPDTCRPLPVRACPVPKCDCPASSKSSLASLLLPESLSGEHIPCSCLEAVSFYGFLQRIPCSHLKPNGHEHVTP